MKGDSRGRLMSKNARYHLVATATRRQKRGSKTADIDINIPALCRSPAATRRTCVGNPGSSQSDATT